MLRLLQQHMEISEMLLFMGVSVSDTINTIILLEKSKRNQDLIRFLR